MEGVKKWHHGVPDDEQYEIAMAALEKAQRAVGRGEWNER